MTEARCPICGFIFTKRWMYYLTKLTKHGVQEANRQRRKFSPKLLTDRYLVVRCEECRTIYPDIWDTQSWSWSSFSLRRTR